MLDVVWLIPALPLAGFLIILLFGRRLGDPKAGYLATLMCLGAFIVTVGVYFDLLSLPGEERTTNINRVFSWVPVGSLKVDLAFLADPLSITMCLFVTGIGTLIHLYAIGYMHGDPRFSKFFLYLNLFALSMLVLVLGENMLVTFLGWEGVGTCSYFLIAFWHERTSAATAGKKAFVTNRVGDWGFMMAMFFAFQATGTLSYLGVNGAASTMAQTTATAIALFCFIGAVGKSAQLPLYLWLPDAMEGPTPVSALIHAATMVTAGVFLMCRMSPILNVASSYAPTLIAIVGAATALFAATIAVAQNDIKKVLAYSTVSQLGYMFLAVGSGAYTAAIFHMITHAFFKALLFLGSGAVIHGMHNEQDMRRMGALRKVMPVTAVTFIIGWLAIAGVPPFAGFWSKDDILLAAYDKSPVLWAVGLVTALLTAYYMTRQVIMVFYGKARWHDAHEEHGAHGDFEPHESPVIMLAPLVGLAFLSIVGGGINLPFGKNTEKLTQWLEPVVGEHNSTTAKLPLAIIAVAIALLGIGASYLVYSKHKAKPVEPRVLAEAWYYDATVSRFMGGPGRESFEAVAWFDSHVIDGAVNGVGRVVRG
ncbi:MAG TPA: NADH-quinone oxidoreductase subunit L, partial [Ilumatobacteraceae bacterium]|nr:NADH-quinone oxidoreductase subunit L [Ilumatobacteraceae bacterium]